MNVAAQIPTAREPRNSVSPRSIVTTPVIIGFRMYKYGPTATSRRVGSHGASVPSPMRAKSETHHAKSANPQRNNTTPEMWAKAAATVPSTQRVSDDDQARSSHRGTITTTTKGRRRIDNKCRRIVIALAPLLRHRAL